MIEAVREFHRVMQESIDRAAHGLAPTGRTVTDIRWEGPPIQVDRFILREEMRVTIVLDNGDLLVGHGGGKLEALLDIEQRLDTL